MSGYCSACADFREVACELHFLVVFSTDTRQLLQRSRCLPSRMGCNSGEWDVMGDLYRHHPVVRACLIFFGMVSLVIVSFALGG